MGLYLYHGSAAPPFGFLPRMENKSGRPQWPLDPHGRRHPHPDRQPALHGQIQAGYGRSVGEKRIRRYLEDNNIYFVSQKWFSDCRDINTLPFDFYLPDENTIIEFDGRQHFGETNYFTYSFEATKKHDEIKNNYCKVNGIYLIRIPYWNIDKIEEILDKELILHEDIV